MTTKRTLTQADADFLQKQFTKVFATKDDLKSFPTRFDLNKSLDKQEVKFEAVVTNFKDKFYTKVDPILKEVVASREDRLMGTEQHLRNEKRVEKLEKIHPQGKHLATI